MERRHQGPAGVRNILLALHWYHPKLHRGIARYAGEHRWHLADDLSYVMRLQSEWRGAGIITQLFTTDVDPRLRAFIDGLPQPRVVIGADVGNDDHAIGRIAARHLLDTGLVHLATYCPYSPGRSVARFRAFREVLAGAPRVTGHALAFGSEQEAWPRRHRWLRRRLRDLPKPVGVFGLDDNFALEVMEAALDEGLAVPDEVAILGVRNDPLLCETAPVPLSSVENNLERIGYEAAGLLDRVLGGAPRPPSMLLIPPVGVVTRQSTSVRWADHPALSAALRYIERHYREPIGVDDIVRAVPMSQRGLYKAFRSVRGRTIGEELRQRRLDHARRLLTETDWTLGAIALDAGFEEYRNLYHAFRQCHGVSPGSWRSAHGPARPS